MRNVKWLSISIAALMLFATVDTDAKRRRRKRRAQKVKVATKTQVAEYNKLLGKFKWGMSSEKVLEQLESDLRQSYKKKIVKIKDELEQDRQRKELFAELKKLKSSHIKFDGKKNRWDVSMIEHEYAHKNNESMIVRWSKRDRRFYFFHFGKLWKVYIAFNSELFSGKKFADFVNVMERRFGKGTAKWKINVKKESELSHIEWPPAGNTSLKAVDETAFYANFCLVLKDRREFQRVKEGRAINSPKKSSGKSLVDAVTQGDGKMVDPNASIVDQLTGQNTNKPKGQVAKPAAPRKISPKEYAPSSAKKKRRGKRSKKDDPLGGLDI